MRALVVEDDPVSAALVERALESKGIHVELCDLGEEALELAKLYDFDVIVLDLGLPDIDGCQLIKQLRHADKPTPVIVVSSREDAEGKLRALFAGADDFMVKPIDPRELLARQQAVVRRTAGYASSEINLGRMRIDLGARMVWIDDERLPVTAKEYGILELLALRKGTTLTKETFLDHLYGGLDEPEQKIIDVFVCKLRKKISNIAKARANIETVWGHGYVLNDLQPNQEVAEDAVAFAGFDGPGDRQRAANLDSLLLELFVR